MLNFKTGRLYIYTHWIGRDKNGNDRWTASVDGMYLRDTLERIRAFRSRNAAKAAAERFVS